MPTLAKELPQLRVGVGWCMIQLVFLPSSNAKLPTSQYIARQGHHGPNPNHSTYDATINHREFLWLGSHPTKKNYHLPLQHHYHTNPTTTKIIQSFNSHGHLGHPSFIVPTPREVSSLAPLILCPLDIIPRVDLTGISITLIPLRSTFLLTSLWGHRCMHIVYNMQVFRDGEVVGFWGFGIIVEALWVSTRYA